MFRKGFFLQQEEEDAEDWQVGGPGGDAPALGLSQNSVVVEDVFRKSAMNAATSRGMAVEEPLLGL